MPPFCLTFWPASRCLNSISTENLAPCNHATAHFTGGNVRSIFLTPRPLRSDIADSLARFDELWQTMKSKDRCALIELLIARIDYDGVQGSVEIHFHNTGIVTLGTATETSEPTT